MNPDPISMSGVIRIAGHDDIDNLISLVNLAYRPVEPAIGWTHESAIVSEHRVTYDQITSLFATGSFIFVMEHNHETISCIHLKTDNGHGYFSMLATRPDLQAKGYGRMILTHVENYARTYLSISTFQMAVITARTELIEFYLRCGYRQTGQIFPYPIETGIGVPKIEGLTMEILEKRD